MWVHHVTLQESIHAIAARQNLFRLPLHELANDSCGYITISHNTNIGSMPADTIVHKAKRATEFYREREREIDRDRCPSTASNINRQVNAAGLSSADNINLADLA